MINVNQITAQMARMSDPALQQFAAMHKADPYTLSLALSESNRRKEMRQGAQMQQQPQPKVVDQEVAQMSAPAAPQMAQGPTARPDQLPEEVGIGSLPAPNMQRMATGGIVAFDEGGEVPGYAGGVFTGSDPKEEFAKKYSGAANIAAAELGVDPGVILSQWGLETGWGRSKKAVDANNLGNIKAGAGWKGATVKQYDKAEKSNDAYRQYDSLEEFAKDYAALIKNKYPASVGAGKDVAKFAAGLRPGEQGGYATDKNYAPSLINTTNNFLTSAYAGTEPPKGNGVADLGKPFIGNPNIARQASTARATTDRNEQLRINRELPDMIKQVEADRASNAARIPGQMADGNGYGANMSVADEARQRLADRAAAESKGTFFGRLGENLGLSAQTRDVIGKGVEGLAPYMGGASTVVRAPVPAVQASKPLPLRLSGPPAAQAEAGLPGLVPRLEGPSSIVGGSKPIPVSPEGVATLPRTGELVGQAAADEERLRQLAAASNEAKAARAEKLRTGDQLLAQKYDVNAAKAADDAAMAASKLDNRVPNTVLANKIDQGAIQAANVAKVGAMTNAADRAIEGPSEGGLPDMAKAMNLDEESRVIQQAPPEMDPKELKEIGKDATPKSDRKGLSGEDYLMIGLGIMSGQSPHALTNIGEGGLKGLQMVMAGRKEEAESRYRDALAKHYGVTPEIQLVNAMQDPAFAANYNKLMEAKNDPAQLRVLSQEMIKNPAQMEVLKKLDPPLYSMLRANLVSGFMPTPVSSPGGSAAIRAPIQ